MSLIESMIVERDFGGYGDERIDPPKGSEERLVRACLSMFESAQANRAKFTKLWPTIYNYYMGKHWGIRPSWKSSPVENHIFSKIETMLPILTDNRPKIDVLPRDSQYTEYAELLQQLLDHLWDKNDTDDVLVSACKNMLLYGKGFLYTYWDDEKNDICTESIDPECLYPDPAATSIRDARYLIHVAQMSRTDITTYWPGALGKVQRGSRVVPDPSEFKEGRFNDENSGQTSGYEYPEEVGGAFTRIVPWVKADLSGYGDDDDMVQVLQFWVKDPELVEEPAKDEAGNILSFPDGKPILLAKRKYPGGRHIVMVGNRVVHDEINPFFHGQFPYVEINCHPVPGEFWPVSAAQNLLSPQRMLNKLNGQILDNAKLMGNAQWIVELGSGVTAEKITGQPGLVVQVNRGYKAERLPGTPLPNFIIQMVDMARASLDNISGVFDVTQGRKPSGITAGVAIEQLQEAAQTRLRLLVRNIENAIRNLGYQQIALAQQFYQEPRTIRIQDDMGGYQFVELTPQMIQGQWEVVVAAGSTLPRSRESRMKEALDLFDRGIYDAEDVLNWIDHPGKDKVIQKIKMQQSMQAQLDQMFPQEAANGSPSGAGGGAKPFQRTPTTGRPQVSTRGNGKAGPANHEQPR